MSTIIVLAIFCLIFYFYFKNSKSVNSKFVAYRVFGDGSYSFEIVGEASYQDNLREIAGEKEDRAKDQECIAIIRPEPNNKYDPNAIAVGIDNRLVGYFERNTAKRFHKFLKNNNLDGHTVVVVEAMIVGGWSNRGGSGHYGVKLNVPKNFDKWELNEIE